MMVQERRFAGGSGKGMKRGEAEARREVNDEELNAQSESLLREPNSRFIIF